MMSKIHSACFAGQTPVGQNMVSLFKEAALAKHPNRHFNSVRAISIDADPGTVVTLNDEDFVICSTRILQFDIDVWQITNIVFNQACDVIITYAY